MGQQLRQMWDRQCDLIYVTDAPNRMALLAMWEMHVSGFLPTRFTGRDVKEELVSLRYTAREAQAWRW